MLNLFNVCVNKKQICGNMFWQYVGIKCLFSDLFSKTAADFTAISCFIFINRFGNTLNIVQSAIKYNFTYVGVYPGLV